MMARVSFFGPLMLYYHFADSSDPDYPLNAMQIDKPLVDFENIISVGHFLDYKEFLRLIMLV